MNKLKKMTSYLAGERVMGYLLGALVFLVIADGLISRFLVTAKIGREANPFLQGLVGQDVFLWIKVLGVLFCAFILWDIYKQWPRLAKVSSLCFVVIYSGIVLWNLLVFFL